MCKVQKVFKGSSFHSQEVAGLYKNFENLSKKWWFFYNIFDKSHLNLNGCKKKKQTKKKQPKQNSAFNGSFIINQNLQ